MREIKSMIAKQLDSLLNNENNNIANLANSSALLIQNLDNISWAGFYLYDDTKDELILGPFQGKVACVHIKNGSGVCGTALKQQKIQRVKDVNEFPGHITCDSNSKSEIVIPIVKNKHKIGVLDIDAPILNRFSMDDENILVEFTEILIKHLNIDKI